jgi:uncharacterized membrane protein required for colicin V production
LNIFDILILGFVLLGALQGYRQGLISGVVSLLGSLLGLILAAKEHHRVLIWIEAHTPIREWLEPAIYKLMLPSVESQAQVAQQQTLDKILSMFPKELRDLIGSGTVPSDFQVYTQNVIQEVAKNLAGTVTNNLLKVVAFMVTYSLIVLVIQVLASLILSPLGFFSGTVNRGGGFFIGGLASFIGISVFVGILSPFISLAEPNTTWGLLQKSAFYPYLTQTFSNLVQLLRINLDLGITSPLDFTKIKLPNLY